MKSGNSSPTRKRLKQKVSERRVVDRLSNLPERVISHILSLLPTKNAAATSVLSKRWKLRWIRVTSIDVDDELWAKKRVNDRMVPKKDFAGFVQMVLRNQTGDSPNQVRLLCKSTSHKNRGQYSFLRNWANQVKLPGELYTCENLQVLKLAGPVLIDLSDTVCLPKLVVLELSSVMYKSDESVGKLISGCPVLQTLTLERTGTSDNIVVCSVSSLTLKRLRICFKFALRNDYNSDMKLEIDTPALEYLVLHDTMSGEISIQVLTSVREVDLETSCGISWFAGSEDDEDNMVEDDVAEDDEDDMVEDDEGGFSRVECLKLGKKTMEGLVDQGLSGNFERLTKLVVSYNPSQQWSFLVNLIARCANLEVLKIMIYSYKAFGETESSDSEGESEDEYGHPKRSWKDPVRVPTCMSSSLRQVTITGFDDHKGLMAMLKYILGHGLVMESVNLSFHESYHSSFFEKKKHMIDYEESSYEDDSSDAEERSSDNERGSDDDRSDCEDDDSDDDGDGVCYEAKYPVLNKVLMLSRASPACKIRDIGV